MSATDTLRAVPLPYLTTIFKTYVKDFTAMRYYITRPLMEFACHAIECSRSRDDLDNRATYLAVSKEHFIEDVYLSAASTQIKKDLFSIPLNAFFDICVEELSGKGLLPDIGVQVMTWANCMRIDKWLRQCAWHPDADIDRTLGPLLRQYEAPSTTDGCICTRMISESDFESQVASIRIFRGLTNAVRNFATPQVSPRPKDVVDAIRQYVQLAMNAVDIWLLHTATNAGNQDRREAILHEGEKTMLWAWRNMLHDPFSGLTDQVKDILAKSSSVGNIEYLMRHLVKHHALDGVASKHLHFRIYNILVHAAMGEVKWLWSEEVGSAIEAEFDVFENARELINQGSSMAENYRPKGTQDQVTAELEARIVRYYHLGPTGDVPVEPIGPRIDPLQFSKKATEAGGDQVCPICQVDFTNAEEFVTLDACKHLLHLDCLDALVNQAYPGSGGVKCPCCRVELCETRDYKAVLDS